jgi:CheY-like chemotaxis protein/HPt (histidine-containing phosphotransfer) domain-containing protein
LRVWVADTNGDAQEGLGTMVRALGWSTQMVAAGARLLEIIGSTPPAAWPDVLILDLHLPASDTADLIARLQKATTQAELPPLIVVASLAEFYVQHEPPMRTMDVCLVRPVTSSALFNAINSAVFKRSDGHGRMGHSTQFDHVDTQWLAGVRVLVVDDSDINLEVAQRILQRQGATVATCSHGRGAVEYVRANHQGLDLVLMDVQMPVLDGNEATRRIRNELDLPSLPIVALTAGALVGERQRSIEAGMNDFVSKPFDPLTLIRKVRRLVEQVRGSPIPVVTLDSKPAPHAAGRLPVDRLKIPSIDAAVVQQMFGDDHALFESLLLRLLRDNADLALPISVCDDETVRAAVKGRAHRLKGSAGMIGATGVARLAGAAETALLNHRPAEAVETALRQLAAALTSLREETDLFLATRPEAPAMAAVDVVNGAELAAAGFDALCGLLESQNLEAVDKFAVLSRSLRELMDTERFDRLHEAIDNLDFQVAAKVLRDGPIGGLRDAPLGGLRDTALGKRLQLPG